jgi:hypothetical protein
MTDGTQQSPPVLTAARSFQVEMGTGAFPPGAGSSVPKVETGSRRGKRTAYISTEVMVESLR